MSKLETSEGFYDDGLAHTFVTSKPLHIRFEVQTGTQDGESCDLRLTTLRRLSQSELDA